MMKRSLVVALVLVVVIAGFSVWEAYAQGPGGNNAPPCGQYYGPGMMRGGHMTGGWNARGDCPFANNGWRGRGMMNGWNAENCPYTDQMWGSATGNNVEMTLTVDDARAAAQAYLDENYPGLTVDEEVWTVNGYYMLHILEDGQLVGMLSVNGATGDVRLHHRLWTKSPQDV